MLVFRFNEATLFRIVEVLTRMPLTGFFFVFPILLGVNIFLNFVQLFLHCLNSDHLCVFFCFSYFGVVIIETQLITKESDDLLMQLIIKCAEYFQLLYFNVLYLEISLQFF